MTPRILWVDDEASLIESMKRQLRTDFDITAAHSGDEGLMILSRSEPFGVIVSDQRMPGMDGIEFLSLAKDISPDSIRIMLTGFAEQETAIEAVNQGHIFRFLTKPCPPHVVLRALRDATRQFELVTAEHELLEKTLTGSIGVLMDILALANPVAFRHAARVGEYATKTAALLKVAEVWQLKAAAMLAHMGYITLPASVLENYYSGRHLSPEEESMMHGQVENTSKLLAKIPRMDPVIRIIHEHDRSRNTALVKARDAGTFAANLLHTVVEFDRMLTRGLSRTETIRVLSSKSDEFNPDIVNAVSTLKAEENTGSRRMVMVDQLGNGMIMDEDVRTSDGMLLVPRGYVINDTVRQRLRNFHLHGEIDGTIAVLCE
ncbi:MAG TPA: response regulator [Opitutales bacterium]|nr:response regulator [Opitutales bacterium]